MIKVKEVILKKLKESTQDYVSGEELSNILGVSRTAVWKCINELKKEGMLLILLQKRAINYVMCLI